MWLWLACLVLRLRLFLLLLPCEDSLSLSVLDADKEEGNFSYENTDGEEEPEDFAELVWIGLNSRVFVLSDCDLVVLVVEGRDVLAEEWVTEDDHVGIQVGDSNDTDCISEWQSRNTVTLDSVLPWCKRELLCLGAVAELEFQKRHIFIVILA